MRTWLHLGFVVLCAVFTSCASYGPIRNMEALPKGSSLASIEAGKAQIVCVRPRGPAPGIQASVFEIVDEKPVLIGISASGTRFAHAVAPGQHLFMVVSEAADFLSADVEAGKTYYMRVVPRMGAWKARFSLDAVGAAECCSKRFESQLEDCRPVAMNGDSEKWASENMSSVLTKYAGYYPKWMEKRDSARPHLAASDGR